MYAVYIALFHFSIVYFIWCYVFLHYKTHDIPKKFRRFSSVQSLSRVWLFATPWIAAHQACPSPTRGIHSNSCPLSWWCHPAISSSVTPFFSCPQIFPNLLFPVSQPFASGGASSSASVLPMNIQDWFPLWLTSLVSLLSKGLSRVFPSTTIWKH